MTKQVLSPAKIVQKEVLEKNKPKIPWRTHLVPIALLAHDINVVFDRDTFTRSTLWVVNLLLLS